MTKFRMSKVDSERRKKLLEKSFLAGDKGSRPKKGVYRCSACDRQTKNSEENMIVWGKVSGDRRQLGKSSTQVQVCDSCARKLK